MRQIYPLFASIVHLWYIGFREFCNRISINEFHHDKIYTMEKNALIVIVVFTLLISACVQKRPGTTIDKGILKWEYFSPYIETFNNSDDELYQQFIPNDRADAFLKNNIPYFECPDKELEEIYYFRWWTYRKHIKKTPVGFVITEFLPDVSWSGKYNTISCPPGHHFYEG